jgi:hypothetical protein
MKKLLFLTLFTGILHAKQSRATLYNESKYGCHTVHIFSLQYVGGKVFHADLGHSGIAVDNEFFDYGGMKLGFWGSIVGRPAGPYLDRKLSARGNLNTLEAYKAVPTYQKQIYKTKVLVFAVTEEEAQNIKNYWTNLYKNPGKYAYLGRQCTSTVYRSLLKANLIDPVEYGAQTQFPKYFYNYARSNLRFTCGRYRGSRPLVVPL